MKANYRSFLIVTLLLGLLFAPTHLTRAQDAPGVSSLTLSEAAINAGLQEANRDPNTVLVIDLQPGQFIIQLSVTGQRGNVTRFALTVVPSISASRELELTSTRLTINDLDIPLNTGSDNAAIDNTVSGVTDLLSQQTQSGQLQSVVVTDTQLTIAWLNANADDPIVTIVDNLFSLTFSEASINRLPSVIEPTDPLVSAVNVDLQPGKALINTTYTTQSETVVYELIPTVTNNRVAWQINATADVQGSVTNTVVTVWRAYFDGIYKQDGLINTVITEDDVTFTWDLDALATDPTVSPEVTYTVTEAEVNATLATFLDDELSELAVDMQPGQVIITAAGVDAAATPYTASLTMIPTFANGRVTWAARSVTINGLSFDLAAAQASDAVTGALTQGLEGTGSSATVIAFDVNDNQMVVTVRYSSRD